MCPLRHSLYDPTLRQLWQEKWAAERARQQVLMPQPANMETDLSGVEKPLLGPPLADQTPDHNA